MPRGRGGKRMIEEVGDGVTHIDRSRRGKKRQRKVQQTEYHVLDADVNPTPEELPEATLSSSPIVSTNIADQASTSTANLFLPGGQLFDDMFSNDFTDNFSSDFPSSDGPELFNGVLSMLDNGVDSRDASPADEDVVSDEEPDPSEATPASRRRYRRTALEIWIQLRQEYLETEMEHEGKGDEGGCTSCSASVDAVDGQRHRCRDCWAHGHQCPPCMVRSHMTNPFHRLQMWNGRFWEQASLHEHGYELHLGHNPAQPCLSPLERKTMTILHINGFHRRTVVFCGCGQQRVEDMEPRRQLLRNRLFPASTISPATAFTFNCMDIFVQLSSQSSVSAYDFYYSMRHVTDNIDVGQWPKRYDELAHVVRCYRHLLMLKRGGRCHDRNGVGATKTGELVTGCPACPHPGKNVFDRDGWRNVPYWKQFLYQLFWAMDANFRLKRKLRGSRDELYLSPDWGYFVHPADHEHERERVNTESAPDPEPEGTCHSTFAAIERANSKGSEGYAYTGVGAVICARHGFLLPSVVNLKKGERQLDMDLALLSSVNSTESDHRRIRLSYDIACRYGLRLWQRIPLFAPKYSQPVVGRTFDLGIPKFHLPGHGSACHSIWSLNYRSGWARTDGEGIERFWSTVNRFATATREMTSGNRHDFLDYAIGATNFRKLCGLGTLLHDKLKEAVKKIDEHSALLNELEEACGEDEVLNWKQHEAAWQEDTQLKPDPYQEVFEAKTSTSLALLRKEMAREEAGALVAADREGLEDNDAKMTASSFILQGIELEAMQSALKIAASKKHVAALTEEMKVEEKRTSLLRRILKWTDAQAIYMPHAFAFRHGIASTSVPDPLATSPPRESIDDDDSDTEVDGDDLPPDLENETPSVLAEEYKLYLPSALPDEVLCLTPSHLIEKEKRVRMTVLDATLHELRRLLRVKMNIINNKRSFVVGQKGNTRAQKLVTGFSEKIDNTAERYREVREALLRLDSDGEWTQRFRELKKSDVRMPQEPDDPDDKRQQRRKKKLGEGHRVISWIWRVSDVSSDGNDAEVFGEAMRVEWAKASARVTRWSEEKELVLEEMRRTPWYLDWKARWWESIADSRVDSDWKPLRDRCAAYAAKQAHINRALAQKFMSMWRSLLDKHQLSLPGEWPSSF